jgi:hypothetical protein
MNLLSQWAECSEENEGHKHLCHRRIPDVDADTAVERD